MAEEDKIQTQIDAVPDSDEFATPHKRHSKQRSRHSKHRDGRHHSSSRRLLADRDNGAVSADEQDRLSDESCSDLHVSAALDLSLDSSFLRSSNSATCSPSSTKQTSLFASDNHEHGSSPIITVSPAPMLPPKHASSSFRSSSSSSRHRPSRSTTSSSNLLDGTSQMASSAVEDALYGHRNVTSEGEEELLASSESVLGRRMSRDFDQDSWSFLMKSSEVQVDSKLQPVAVYTMEVEHNGRRWTISRRFNNFYQLDINLDYTFGGKMHLPNLPKKKFFKRGSDPPIMRERRKLLEQYMCDLCRLPVVTQSDLWLEWVQAVQSFYPLVPPDKCGFLLQQRSLRGDRRYYFSVKGPLFVVYKDIESPPTALDTPNEVVWIGGSTVKEGNKKMQFTFVPHSGKSYTLESSTEEDAESWISLLRKVASMLPVTPVSSPAIGTLPAPVRPPWLIPAAGVRREPEKPLHHSPLLREQSPPSTGTYKEPEKPHHSPLLREQSSPSTLVNTLVLGSVPSSRSAGYLSKNHSGSPPRSDATLYRSRRHESFGDVGNNSSLMELMQVPPSPALKPRNGPYLPGQSYFSSSDEGGLSDRVYEEKHKADLELKLISFSLQNEIQQAAKNGSASPVVRQIAQMVDQLLNMSPEELVETDISRETMEKLQELRFHPVVSRVLFVLAPLARAVMAEQIARENNVQEKGSGFNSVSGKPINFPTGIDSPAVTMSPQVCSPVMTPRSPSPLDPAEQNQTSSLAYAKSSFLSNSLHLLSSDSDPLKMGAEVGSMPPQKLSDTAGKRKSETNLMRASGAIGLQAGFNKSSSVLGTPLQRPMRMLTRQSSTSNAAQSLRSARMILCRICEEEYPQSVVRTHTEYCKRATEFDPTDTQCDNRLRKMIRLVKGHRRRIANESYYSQDAYVSIETIASQAKSLRYGENDAVARCWDLITSLQRVLAYLSYDDIGLVTYGRRIAMIMEEKWANLRKFEKLQADKQMNADTWGLLGLAKSQFESGLSQTANKSEELLMHSTTRISIEDFEIIKKISSGAYGKVYLARKRKTMDLYAVKIQKKSDMCRKNMVDNVMAERRILSNASNPYIVKLYYAFQNERYLYLVMEYCCGGDVATLLRNLVAFDLDMTRIYAAETVLSLVSLHKQSYVHRDLKPDNMLINEKGHIVLTDFGLSTIGVIDRTEKQQQQAKGTGAINAESVSPRNKPRVVGTPDYLAPEILLATGHGGPEVDWWALGVIVYEFLTGVPPFSGESPEEIFDRVLRRDILWPKDMDPVARDFIEKLLVLNPDQRLGHNGPDEVMSHPFFNGINWDTVYQESREDIFVPQLENPEDTSYFDDHGEMIASQHAQQSPRNQNSPRNQTSPRNQMSPRNQSPRNQSSSPRQQKESPLGQSNESAEDPVSPVSPVSPTESEAAEKCGDCISEDHLALERLNHISDYSEEGSACQNPSGGFESPPLTPGAKKEFDDFNFTNTEILMEKTLQDAKNVNDEGDIADESSNEEERAEEAPNDDLVPSCVSDVSQCETDSDDVLAAGRASQRIVNPPPPLSLQLQIKPPPPLNDDAVASDSDSDDLSDDLPPTPTTAVQMF